MVAIPLTWHAQIVGAENVKARLSELNAQFDRGEITVQQYATGIRQVNRDSRAFSNTLNIQKNVFLATHPVLNNISRAMSIFGSVSRAAITAINAINIAMIALNTNSAGVAQATADVAQAERELKDILTKFPADSKQAIEAMDALRVAQARLAEETQNRATQINGAWLAVFSGFSYVFGRMGEIAITKVLPFLGGLGGAFTTFFGTLRGLFTGGGAGSLSALFFSQFLDLIPGMQELQAQFADMMRIFFRETIPTILSEGGALFMQGFQNIFNGIIGLQNLFGKGLVDGINSIAQAMIGFINGIISKINSLAKFTKIKIPLIQAPPLLQYSPIAKIGGGGGAVFPQGISPATNPGEFLSPRSTGGGGGTTIVQQITVQGSIVTENEMRSNFDKWLKDALKAIGFS